MVAGIKTVDLYRETEEEALEEEDATEEVLHLIPILNCQTFYRVWVLSMLSIMKLVTYSNSRIN